jgi:glycosyltransferase involved in cell wall biosynthesis
LGVSENLAYFSSKAIDEMNEAGVVYATTDGLALSLANLKKKRFLNTKLVINSMGLFDHPVYLKNIKLLENVDSIIVFSFPMIARLEESGYANVHFVRYGTDIDFYAPAHCEQKPANGDGPVVLGIGLDRKRDWDGFRKASLGLNDIEFRVIAPDNLRKGFEGFSNISFLGNVSYLKTREEICRADAIFLPTKENTYFSGQSTLFNALAMNKPVVMPYDTNFKEYGLDRRLFYDRESSTEDILNLLKSAIGKDAETMKSVEYNYLLIRKEYNQIEFARRLKDVFS